MATDGVAREQLKKDNELAMNAAKTAEGFMIGAGVGSVNVEALLECIYVADEAAQTLEASVEEIEQAYKDKSIKEALIGGVMTVGFIKSVKQAIPVCKSVDPQAFNWTDFDRIVQVIETPNATITVAENIIMNGHTITNDMQSAFEALRAGEYRDYGMALGDTMRRATANHDDLFLY